MGLIEFVKNVGRKLDLNKDNDKPQQRSQGQNPAAAQKAAAQQAAAARDLAQTKERTRESSLASMVNQMGFQVRDLAVDIEGDKALIRGAVDSQADREKIILLVGNTEGIGSVDDRLQVSRQEPEAQFYDVKSGDSLSKIAKQFYGDANKYNLIFEANKPMIKDPDEIYPGQKLRIPAMAATTATARA